MKSYCYFLILLILSHNVISDYQRIIGTVYEHKSYIFSELRRMKASLPVEIQKELEKSIKEYEYRMLVSDEAFGEYIISKYEHLRYLKQESKDKVSEGNRRTKESKQQKGRNTSQPSFSNDTLFDISELIDKEEFSSDLGSIAEELFKFDSIERQAVVKGITENFKYEPFYRDLVSKVLSKAYVYHNDHFNSLEKVLEYLVYFLSTGKTVDKNKKPEDHSSATDEVNKGHSNIPDSFRVSSQFKDFLNKFHGQYHRTGKVSNEDDSQFNKLFHEYLHEAVIHNEEFKEAYTKNKIKDDRVLELLQKDKLNKSKGHSPSERETGATVGEANSTVKDPQKPNALSSFLAVTESNRISGSDSLKDKKMSYGDYMENTTDQGFFHRQSREVIFDNTEDMERKINSINNALQADHPNTPATGSFRPFKDIIPNNNIKEEALLKKAASQDLLKESQELGNNIKQRRKKDLQRATIKEQEQIQGINHLKKTEIAMKKTKAKPEYSAKTSSMQSANNSFLSIILKPIMLILEQISKIPAKIIKEGTKPLVKKVIKIAVDHNLKKRAKKEAREILDLSGNCTDAEEKLKDSIQKQLQNLKDEQEEAKKDLSEVRSSMLKNVGDPKQAASTLVNIIIEFIKKLVQMIIKHIPFYFFKICIPPGPLTFGCCPEASFFPQQLYAIFTVFEKVEKFKISASAYPTWLASIGNEEFTEVEYYMCAQSYLTLTESTLFNFCNPMTLVVIHPMNLMGMNPGDLPMCFWACLQTIIVCQVWISKIPECDALINLQVIIKAMLSIPDRLKLMYIFSQCTYIPFLIRWDLVPPWKPEQKEPGFKYGQDTLGSQSSVDPADRVADPRAKPELNCADSETNSAIRVNARDDDRMNNEKRDKQISPFAQALINITPEGRNIINNVHREIVNTEEKEQAREENSNIEEAFQLLSKYRGAVRRSLFESRLVDAANEDWNPSPRQNISNSREDQEDDINSIPKNDLDETKEKILDEFSLFHPQVTDILGNSNEGEAVVIKHIESYSSYLTDHYVERIKEKRFPFHALRILVSSEDKNIRTVTGLPEGYNNN